MSRHTGSLASVLVALVMLIAAGTISACHVEFSSPSAAPGAATITPPAVAVLQPSVTLTTIVEPAALPPTRPPSPTPYSTETPIPSGRMHGTWHQVTMQNGLCTDAPQLIGWAYVGAVDSTTLCYPAAGAGIYARHGTGEWTTMTLPIGTRVTGAVAHLYTTDAGMCAMVAANELQCFTPAEGFPYTGIRALVPMEPFAAYLLDDAVAYSRWPTGTTVSISGALGNGAAHPTAVTGRQQSPDKEIWVGTNGYGILVIAGVSRTTWRYTMQDGLPSDTIRDLDAGGEWCPKGCTDLVDVWIATDRGVGHWDGVAWRTYTVADGLPADDIVAVSSAQYRTAWALTAAGPAYFDGQTWQAVPLPDGLPAGALRDVVAGPDEVWFATDGAGLMIYVIYLYEE